MDPDTINCVILCIHLDKKESKKTILAAPSSGKLEWGVKAKNKGVPSPFFYPERFAKKEVSVLSNTLQFMIT